MHGPKWPFLLAHGPGVVGVKCCDRLCILGRAPRTKETLPDFHEWCRVTRHPPIFHGLRGGQRDTPGLGRHTSKTCLSTLNFTCNFLVFFLLNSWIFIFCSIDNLVENKKVYFFGDNCA